MADWSYGDAGDRYPVQDGDVWRVGPHVFLCGDLERGDAQRLLEIGSSLLGKIPQMFYSDPPWDKGNAKSFRTKAGVSRPVIFENLMAYVMNAASQVRGDVFVEMGRQHAGDMSLWMAAAQINFVRQWGITYYRKHPCVLTHGAKVPFLHTNAQAPDGFEGLDDDDTPELAIRLCSNPGDLVLETCLGRGLTSRACQKQGRVCLGMELNPRRMACAIDALAKGWELPVEKIRSIL